MTSRNHPDVALGAIFALSGLAIFSQALSIRSMPGLPVGPGLFPAITGGAMLLFGALLAVQSWATPADREALDGDAQRASGGGFFSPFVLGVLLATLASIFAMPVLGFVITALLYTFAIVILGGGRWVAALIFSPIATAAVYALFAQGFRVPLPRGLLG